MEHLDSELKKLQEELDKSVIDKTKLERLEKGQTPIHSGPYLNEDDEIVVCSVYHITWDDIGEQND